MSEKNELASYAFVGLWKEKIYRSIFAWQFTRPSLLIQQKNTFPHRLKDFSGLNGIASNSIHLKTTLWNSLSLRMDFRNQNACLQHMTRREVPGFSFHYQILISNLVKLCLLLLCVTFAFYCSLELLHFSASCCCLSLVIARLCLGLEGKWVRFTRFSVVSTNFSLTMKYMSVMSQSMPRCRSFLAFHKTVEHLNSFYKWV